MHLITHLCWHLSLPIVVKRGPWRINAMSTGLLVQQLVRFRTNQTSKPHLLTVFCGKSAAEQRIPLKKSAMWEAFFIPLRYQWLSHTLSVNPCNTRRHWLCSFPTLILLKMMSGHSQGLCQRTLMISAILVERLIAFNTVGPKQNGWHFAEGILK